MAESSVDFETTLRLTRVIDAPRDRVFAAWTDPSKLRAWWGPEGYTTPIAEVDLRQGGRYRLGMQAADGDIYFVSGVFREVRVPEKLVYTWAFDQNAPMTTGGVETIVTVEFLARGTSTELVLTHERFADSKSRDQHGVGWEMGFEALADYLASV